MKIEILKQSRPGAFVRDDLVKYTCEDRYKFAEEGDYVYWCKENGLWNSSRNPLCITGSYF